ncbi:MAG TPA: orotate phosphoribosyltransferase [Saprospiraceae bacterium]|nr:orotate phosphoribosyltransferase [Saprospiraceae bacterium]HMP13201.1 orotate phosphoribosyltransferase [Saprospiraceae bacterium]
MTTKQAIAQRLLQIKAIKLSPQSPFTWASGWLSPIYCDNRIVLSYPAIRREIIQAFAAKSAKLEPFDVVAGVATAGIAHGALLAEALDRPFVYVRAQAKSHGRQNAIEGHIETGARVLLIEDLISTGGSSLAAVQTLREANAVIVGVLAIFTYGFPEAETAFAAAGCPFDTLTDYDALLQAAMDVGYIQNEDLDTLKTWRQAPENWGKPS